MLATEAGASMRASAPLALRPALRRFRLWLVRIALRLWALPVWVPAPLFVGRLVAISMRLVSAGICRARRRSGLCPLLLVGVAPSCGWGCACVDLRMHFLLLRPGFGEGL